MSRNPQFDRSKTLVIFGGVVSVLLLITYTAFHRESGQSEHILQQVQSNDFEKVVLKSDMPVVVDFYADWCGPCKMMSPILAEFSRENPKVKVVQVNVDENAELASRYGINTIPALFVFKKGELTAQKRGLMSKDALKALIDQ